MESNVESKVECGKRGEEEVGMSKKENCRKGPRAEGQRSDLISLKQLIKSSLDLQNRRIIGVYLGGYSNNTERFGTFC